MIIIYLITLLLVTYGQHICSTNGFYDEMQKQCICDLGYFLDDCSSEGIQLIDELILQEDQQYYIYGFALNQTLRIYLDNELYSIYIKYQGITQSYEYGVFKQLQLLKNQENFIDITSGQTNTIFIIYIQNAHGNISQKPQFRVLSDSHNDSHDHSSDNNSNSGTDNKASIIAAIIAPIVSIFLMIIIGLYCYKKIKRRRQEQQQLAQQQQYIKPKVSVQRVRKSESIIRQPPRLIELQLANEPRQKINTSKMSNISGVEECSICLQPLSKTIVSTPCNHKFHTGCIKEFLAYQKNCPLCRTELQDNQLLIIK